MRVSTVLGALTLSIPAIVFGAIDSAPGQFQITTFLVPALANQTSLSVEAVNSTGEIVGFQTDTSGDARGFLRYAHGAIQKISNPDNTGSFFFTEATGINAKGEIAGYYFDTASGDYSGFFYKAGTYTTYTIPDLPAGSATTIFGINNLGDFCGYYQPAPVYNAVPYINHQGTITTFTIANSTFTECMSINKHLTVSGTYYDGTTYHGYIRTAAGKITVIDVPGAAFEGTIVLGLNDRGWTSGHFFDSANIQHGFLRSPAGKFYQIDVPGAATSAGLGTSGGGLTENCTVVGHFDPVAGPPEQGYIATPAVPCTGG